MNEDDLRTILREQGGPYEDESGGEDVGGDNDDENVFAGGDDDGGPAMRRRLNPRQQAQLRSLAQKCRRGGLQYQHPTTPRNLGSNSHVSNLVHKDAPNKQFGLRFIREAGCTITSCPIPVEARATPAVTQQVLRDCSFRMPKAPISQAATVAALPTFDRVSLALPPAGERDDFFAFALRLDFGLQGLFVPAASPITFDVFSKVTTAADPIPGGFGEFNGVSTGSIILTPWRNSEAFTVVMLVWNIVQSLPHPREYDLYNDNVAYYPAARAVEITTRITTAPQNTSLLMTLLTPTHPSWQKMISELGCC